MKVAIVYDRVNKFGGAERLLCILHEIFPNAPLYTTVYNRTTAKWADVFEVRPTFLQQIPLAKTNHEYLAPLIPLAFESFNFHEFDIVISVTSEYAKGIVTGPKTLHICYCLTPTRYLWSGYKEYFSDALLRWATAPLVSYLRLWDKIASGRPDAYVAISKTVQERIKRYYRKESIVIYPPVFLPMDQELRTKDSSKFFLIVSRLVPYKRIDIAIEACNRLSLPLKIIGSGRERSRLKTIAGGTIEFLQNLTDAMLSRYYQDCIALLFPGEEDFGLSIIEAQSFGKPVIAYKGGGALETIVEGKTGEFFYPQTVDALMRALQRFTPKRYDQKDCIRRAEKFSKEAFTHTFGQLVTNLHREYKKVS